MNNNETNLVNILEESMEDNSTQPVQSTPKRRGRPPKVERDIFIEMWNKAPSLSSVADALGMPVTSVSVKASGMRKQGAKLKRFARGRKAKVKS